MPKCQQVAGPRDLRPISLSSAMAKLFCSLLLHRTRKVILPVSSAQCAFARRQAADCMFSGIRSFQLETEWRHGCHWLRLDIAKAFDRIRRDKILNMLRDRLPENMSQEFACWRDLMTANRTEVRTPWGCTRIAQTRGVRQGSVESPFLFSMSMELALAASTSHPSWPADDSWLSGYPAAELLYMDDGVLQAGFKTTLETKVNLLVAQLAEWGLELNGSKCTYYRSPYAVDTGPIQVAGAQLPAATELQMMGISLAVPLKLNELMRPTLQKARHKYFALQHLLEANTPLKERLKLFARTVQSSALWCASVLPPTSQALGEANAAQLELVARMMHNRRKAGETWVQQRVRGLREARAMLHLHGHLRWSSVWLTRRWTYLGHTARAAEQALPPPSTLVCQYRTLQ